MPASLVSKETFLRAVAGAATIELSAYTLRRGEPVVRAIERAADHGARASVTLEGAPFEDDTSDGLAKQNRFVARELRGHGVDVHLTGADERTEHLKAAIVDGTAFLDDCNWPAYGTDTIVATRDRDDVAAVTSALAGKPGADRHLATDKSAALELEARAILNAAGEAIDAESESFGSSAVSKAIRYRAAHGTHVRLLVAAHEFAERNNVRERATLQSLAASGVEVRVAWGVDEKMCVGEDRGWIGSANATYAGTPMADWGMFTMQTTLLEGLRAAFERNWNAARPM